MIKAIDISLLIAFFGSYNSKVRGRTRIQKDVCILKYRDKIPFNFEFESHYYGPYSSELADTINTLVAAGLLKQNVTRLSPDIRRYDYALTEEGKEMLQRVKVALRQEEPVLLEQLVRKTGKLKQLSIPQAIALSKKCSGIQSSN